MVHVGNEGGLRMNRLTRLAAATALATIILGTPGAIAQSTDTTPPPGMPGMMHSPGMMGGPQGRGMMAGMPMMSGMQMMSGCDGAGMGMMGSGMDMSDHMDGRIAFLHAELKITAAQENAWGDFAAALRKNAQSMREAHAVMMATMAGATASGQTLMQRLDTHERMLGAHLDGVRAMKASLGKLYASLSDEQKRSADELLAPQMGMGPRMMGMGSPPR